LKKKKKQKTKKQSPLAQKAYMTTKADKLTLSIVLASHRIKTSRSLNEVNQSCVGAYFVSGLHAFFFCRITLDYFFNGALNEGSVDSNWRVVAAKEYYYYF
jgi:hypothetical protein